MVFMIAQMGQVGRDGLGSVLDDLFHDLSFIVGGGFFIDDGNGSLGTAAQTSPQAIAHDLGSQPGFSFDNLQGAFRATRDAIAASVALGFIDLDDVTCHNSQPG